ncbi:hypothetical protein K501DRAFT_337036 [Backusella circina FSU 941]|nr:hypothetical protein K501DRAFT_337036 [Backusella circina FSU 941]
MSNAVSNTYKRASVMLQKAKGPKWKRELVSDHKFDYIDIEEFRHHTCWLQIKYILLYCSVIKSFMVYGADLWSAGILLIYDRWSLSTQPQIPFYISKWIYVGCIALSFILLAWEIRKTRNVMATRDVSLAVTNSMAYRTYSVRNYSYFCLLHRIQRSTKWSDVVTFYVFYTLKGWKKVIVAQGPRQIIAGITVYALLKSAWTAKDGTFHFSTNWSDYGNDLPQRMALVLMTFTCIVWIFSALSILMAISLYIPVFCRIQGNLKEYCCHKIDKRIDEIIDKQRSARIREREKYANSISSKKSKKNKKSKKDDDIALTPAVPTLPVLGNSNLYSQEKQSPWMYQQQPSYPQTPYSTNNSNSNYYDNGSESSYSLHHAPTTFTQTTNNGYYQPSQPQAAYTTQDNYFYSSPTMTAAMSVPAMTPASALSKPNTYDGASYFQTPPLPHQTYSNNNTTYSGDTQRISDHTASSYQYQNNSSMNRSDTYNMASNTASSHASFNTVDKPADQSRNYHEMQMTPALGHLQTVDVDPSASPKPTTYNHYI